MYVQPMCAQTRCSVNTSGNNDCQFYKRTVGCGLTEWTSCGSTTRPQLKVRVFGDSNLKMREPLLFTLVEHEKGSSLSMIFSLSHSRGQGRKADGVPQPYPHISKYRAFRILSWSARATNSQMDLFPQLAEPELDVLWCRGGCECLSQQCAEAVD